jgi:CBS domain
VRDAARRMAELQAGAMPICGNDDRLKGMITDRDIAVKVVAAGKDPETTEVPRWRDVYCCGTHGMDNSPGSVASKNLGPASLRSSVTHRTLGRDWGAAGRRRRAPAPTDG